MKYMLVELPGKWRETPRHVARDHLIASSESSRAQLER